MNRTITVTLNDVAFDIEENGYEKLKDYFSKIEKYFSHEDAKDEIIKDIENSFASKLEDKLFDRKQKVVLEKDIDDLIKIIGRVEDFEKEDDKEDSKKENNQREYIYKKLYRNPDDMVLAGICSGIASYLNVDSVLIRILFIIFTVFTGFFPGCVIYFILWLILPLASTGTEKLEMSGEKITLENIKEKVVQMKDDIKKATMNERNRSYIKTQIKNIKDEIQSDFNNIKKDSKKEKQEEDTYNDKTKKRQQKNQSYVAHNIGHIFAIFIKVIFIIIGISLISLSIAILLPSIIAIPFIIFDPLLISRFISINNISISTSYSQLIAVLGILVVLIPTIFLLTASVSLIQRKNLFKFGPSLASLILWISLVSALIFFGVKILDHREDIRLTYSSGRIENIATNNYVLNDFNSIDVTGSFLVNINKSENFSVKIKANKDIIDNIKLNVENNKLNIKVDDNFEKIIFNNKPEININLPELEYIKSNGTTEINIDDFETDNKSNKLVIDINGASTLTSNNFSPEEIKLSIKGFSVVKFYNPNQNKIKIISAEIDGASNLYLYDLSSDDISIKEDGASYVYLSGNSKNINITSSGASKTDAKDIETNNAKINLNSASSCEISVDNYLSANLSGASNLRYIGSPEISKVIKDVSIINKIDKDNNQNINSIEK